MAEPCLCSQASAEPTCTISAGAGISISGGETISAHSAAQWVPFTPATTNLTLGNAVNESRYLLVGKTVDVLIALRFGTTSSFTATQWRFGMPPGCVPFFGASQVAVNHEVGPASMRDASAATPFFSGEAVLNTNANPIQVRYGDDAGGTNTVLLQGVPFTWTTGDELVLRFRTEIL